MMDLSDEHKNHKIFEDEAETRHMLMASAGRQTISDFDYNV